MPATDGAMDVDLEADATVRNTFEAGCTAGVDGLSEEAKPFLEFLEIDVLEEQLETGAGATRKVSKGYWATFCDRLQRGQVEPRCIIDFAYSDGGGLNLAEHEQLLERAYCFVDKRDKDGEWRQVVAHVHTLKPWAQAVSEHPAQRAKHITSVNVRHANRSEASGRYKQEHGAESFGVVPVCSDLRAVIFGEIGGAFSEKRNMRTCSGIGKMTRACPRAKTKGLMR